MTRRLVNCRIIALTLALALNSCGGGKAQTTAYGISTIYTPGNYQRTTSTPAPKAESTTVAQAAKPTPRATPAHSPAPAPSASAYPTAGDELDRVIIEAGNYLNGRFPNGEKIAFVSAGKNFPAAAEYVIDGLIEKAVNDGAFSVIDRAQLDAIRLEQEFQLSGAVNDSTVQSIGRILGVKTIVTVTVTQIGSEFRLGIRALDIESARIQGQFNRDISGGRKITALAGAPAPATAVRTAQPATVAAAVTPTARMAATTQPAQTPTTPAISGMAVPGEKLANKLTWLQGNAESHGVYILEVNKNENIAPQTLNYQDLINVTVVLRGVGENRTVRLASNGVMFRVRQNVTFVLDNNITLHGHSGNNGGIVWIDGGTFKMNDGSFIIGNALEGVFVGIGTFEMNGGTISGNARIGVIVTKGTFIMNGGNITDNSAGNGGGVHVGLNKDEQGTFTMNGGYISKNTASASGGGVYIFSGTFTMNGGIISGNRAAVSGGGVTVTEWRIFTMRGGTITGNTAGESGGGVFVSGVNCGGHGLFSKVGGHITGYVSDPNSGNAVKNDGGAVKDKGHAVYALHGGCNRLRITRKEINAGPTVKLSIMENGHGGTWDE